MVLTYSLGGDPGAAVPGKVDSVVFRLDNFLNLGSVKVPGPAVLLAVLDGVLGGGEVDLHVGQRVPGGGPAHKRVLPALAGVELHLPVLDVAGAALHGVLGRLVYADPPGLHVLLGHSRDRGQVHLEMI